MNNFQRMNAIVTAVFRDRGFAFAISEVNGQSHFLHYHDFTAEDEFAELRPGDIVAFTGVQLPGPHPPRGLVVRVVQKMATT